MAWVDLLFWPKKKKNHCSLIFQTTSSLWTHKTSLDPILLYSHMFNNFLVLTNVKGCYTICGIQKKKSMNIMLTVNTSNYPSVGTGRLHDWGGGHFLAYHQIFEIWKRWRGESKVGYSETSGCKVCCLSLNKENCADGWQGLVNTF